MHIAEIISIIEQMAPLQGAASWDVSGLQVAAHRTDATRLAVCLDPSPASVSAALELGAQCILSHHPLALKPSLPNRIDHYHEVLRLLLTNDVPLYAAHTSLDVNSDGPVSWLARELHLDNLAVLEPTGLFDEKDCEIFINTTGRFVVGGPMGDCGLTGRKIIQDTYGGSGHHGGGAFSGKDPSKVDRSAAYMGRYVAKNVVAAGLAPRCEVQIAYCIGVAEPVSVLVSSLGTSDIPDEVLTKAVREVFDLRPYHITKRLDLLRPIYKKTSCYGHFGRELPEFTWEHTDAVADLRTAAKV